MLSDLGIRVLGSVEFVDFRMPCRDDDLAAARHRIACVYHQIHQDLLNLTRVGLDAVNRDRRPERNRNILADHSQQQAHHAAHHFIEVQDFGKDNLPPAKRQKLPRQQDCPVRRFLDLH